ncbi:MAG: hypothetical protein AAF558_09020 [Verrucomicrobiota bacterium]
MKTSTLLRVSIVTQWLLVPVAIVASFFLESYLPDPLQKWLQLDSGLPFSSLEVIALVSALALMVIAFVGSVGLFFLKKWAAWTYLASTLLGYLIYPLLGPTVEHSYVSALCDIATLLTGFTFGLAFFGNALRAE